MDDLALLTLEADVSFTYNQLGRMLQTNEPVPSARTPAPRVWLGRTMAGKTLTRYGATVADDVLARPEADLRAALAPIRKETGGPAYYFREAIAPSALALPVTQANREVARDTFRWLYDEVAYWQPCFAVIRDGQAVSICFSSRVGPRACAAGVDTLAEFRGRGHASTVTAAWAQAVHVSGRVPLYGTDWGNLASQGVARRLHLVQYAATTWMS